MMSNNTDTKSEQESVIPLEMTNLVETPHFENFNFMCESRDSLIAQIKKVSAISGFKAIIPYTDRNNKFSTSITFSCCLASICQRKRATNCPFKITYIKYNGEQYYKLLP